MSSPKLRTEAAAAGNYPEKRFNQRERKLLQTVSNAVRAGKAQIPDDGLIQTIYIEGAEPTDVLSVTLATGMVPPTAKIVSATALFGAIEVTFDSDATNEVLQWVLVQTDLPVT